jgi:hypothetical protein
MAEPRHNPAPWTHETVQCREDRTAYEVVRDANGKALFDSMNSDVAVIHDEHDEDGVTRWDETGRVNLTLAAAAPDLFAACVRANALLSNLMKAVDWRTTFDLDIAALNESLCELPKVIAKATAAA